MRTYKWHRNLLSTILFFLPLLFMHINSLAQPSPEAGPHLSKKRLFARLYNDGEIKKIAINGKLDALWQQAYEQNEAIRVKSEQLLL